MIKFDKITTNARAKAVFNDNCKAGKTSAAVGTPLAIKPASKTACAATTLACSSISLEINSSIIL